MSHSADFRRAMFSLRGQEIRAVVENPEDPGSALGVQGTILSVVSEGQETHAVIGSDGEGIRFNLDDIYKIAITNEDFTPVQHGLTPRANPHSKAGNGPQA